MNKSRLFAGFIALILLWAVVFILTTWLMSRNNEALIDAEMLPTRRPTRTDVALLQPPTEEATEEATEESTVEASPAPTTTPTQRPTAAFTLSALEIPRFQRDQQAEFNENWRVEVEATVEIPRDAGSYPIRLALEDLSILSSVLVVQTDPNFDIVTPREEIGYYALTSKIGGGGNTVLVGHVAPGRVFNGLLDAKVGQIIRVTDEFYEDHYYRVQEIIRFPYEVGNEEDRRLGFEYMYDNSEERLTLVTCYPEFEWTHRFVVRAVPISDPSSEDES